MKFEKTILQEIVDEEYDEILSEVIKDTIVETTRWSIVHECIFKFGGLLYKTSYRRGATEMQEESPYEYDEDMIECQEVLAVKRMITDYVVKAETIQG